MNETSSRSYTIYKHTNVNNGKSYIGCTYKSMQQRWAEHVWLGMNSYRHRSRGSFQNAIVKHGVDSWKHEVLCDQILDKNEAFALERSFIAHHATLYPRGYNHTHGGDRVDMSDDAKIRHRKNTLLALKRPDVHERFMNGIRRGHSTPEFIEKNRLAQKLAQNSLDVRSKKRDSMKAFYSRIDYVNPMSRKVIQSTLDDVDVAIYFLARAASDITGTNHSKITEVARGSRNVSGGFKWRYCDDNR